MIEIEKKFILTPEQEKSLTEGAEFLGEKKFTDVYYDDDNFSLTKKDIWLRQRDEKFELKLPMNESIEKRISDQYLELDNEKDILSASDYKPFCSVTTTRRKYKKDDFGIDLDIMDFGYTLAEIEYMTEDVAKIKEATQSIIEFAKKHHIDTKAVIRGKIVKYLELNNPAHFQALINAKVIKNV